MQPQTIGTFGDVIHHHGRIPWFGFECRQSDEEARNHEKYFKQIVQTCPTELAPHIACGPVVQDNHQGHQATDTIYGIQTRAWFWRYCCLRHLTTPVLFFREKFLFCFERGLIQSGAVIQ